MENFKLDLTQLTPVAEADRVRGNWYVVADEIKEQRLILEQYHESNEDLCGCPWNYWFAIPPNLPGLPKGELPDEFELKAGEWEWSEGDCFRSYSKSIKYRRIKPALPELTIPSGTIQEQIEAMRKKIEELETKAGK